MELAAQLQIQPAQQGIKPFINVVSLFICLYIYSYLYIFYLFIHLNTTAWKVSVKDTSYLSVFSPNAGNAEQNNSEYEQFLLSVLNFRPQIDSHLLKYFYLETCFVDNFNAQQERRSLIL